jgi:hypothetical protein
VEDEPTLPLDIHAAAIAQSVPPLLQSADPAENNAQKVVEGKDTPPSLPNRTGQKRYREALREVPAPRKPKELRLSLQQRSPIFALVMACGGAAFLATLAGSLLKTTEYSPDSAPPEVPANAAKVSEYFTQTAMGSTKKQRSAAGGASQIASANGFGSEPQNHGASPAKGAKQKPDTLAPAPRRPTRSRGFSKIQGERPPRSEQKPAIDASCKGAFETLVNRVFSAYRAQSIKIPEGCKAFLNDGSGHTLNEYCQGSAESRMLLRARFDALSRNPSPLVNQDCLPPSGRVSK